MRNRPRQNAKTTDARVGRCRIQQNLSTETSVVAPVRSATQPPMRALANINAQWKSDLGRTRYESEASNGPEVSIYLAF